MAHIAKVTGRPVKMMLPKDQELAHLNVKPENITKFKVGAKKDGRIVALPHEVYVSVGDSEGGGHATAESGQEPADAVHLRVPHWKSIWYSYKTNVDPDRAISQQHAAGGQVGLGKHDG